MGSDPSKRSKRKVAWATAVVSFVTMFSTAVSAQSSSQWAADTCSAAGYNFIIGIVYVIMGLSLMVLLSAVFGGAAAKTLGWASRSISKMGNAGIVMGISGGIVILFALGVLGLAISALPVTPPSECMIPI